MKIREGMEDCFAEHVLLNNENEYGAKILRYAERWAQSMEQAMEEADMTVAESAAITRALANTEWISRSMYYFAAAQLREFWIFGDDLTLFLNEENSKRIQTIKSQDKKQEETT